MSVFSEKLRELVLEHNLSQKIICEKLFLGRSQISNWVNDKAEPDFTNLTRLAQFFDVTIDYLLGIEDLENSNEDGKNPLGLPTLTNVFSAGTQEERELLRNFRKLPKDKQDSLLILSK